MRVFCGIHNVTDCKCSEPKPGDVVRLKGGVDEFDVRTTFMSHYGAAMLLATSANGYSSELRAQTAHVELVEDALDANDVNAAFMVATKEFGEDDVRTDYGFVARALREYINDGREQALTLAWLDESYVLRLRGNDEWPSWDEMAKEISRDVRQKER